MLSLPKMVVIARKVGLLLVALFLVLLPAASVSGLPPADDSLWVEAEFAVKSGNRVESLRLLRLCVLGRLNLPDSELMLRQALASEAAAICAGRPINELRPAELQEFHKVQSEICGLAVADAGDWLLLLKASMAIPGSQNLVVSGQAFLEAVQRGLPVAINQDWRTILEKLDNELVRDEQVLYRLQIATIFAGLEPGSKVMQQKLADARLVADAKAVKIIRFAEVEMALGNLAAARDCLDQVRNFDPAYSGLEEMYRQLAKAERIDEILVQANDALVSKNFDEAKRRADEVFSLDPNNFFARRIVEQVEESRQRPTGAAMTEADRVQLKIRRLEADLRFAEKEEDLLQISICLREILMLKSDPAFALKLAEVEEEIAFSRLKSEERLAEAEILFRKGEYARLRLFLNRNPGLMNSLEKMLQIWEMRLMANFATGFLEPARLRESALEINRRAGRSFYASYVLMRLDMADNKFADAQAHYKIAAELKPGDASLRWPGMLLWAHGDGRPAAVIVLIILFLLLIKMVVPFFTWFESTYWWRISLLSNVFPSLAIGSLESCFGAVKERGERITLFTLLMQSCYRVGKYEKALLYAENLLELVPGSAAALEMRSRIKGRTAKAVSSQEKDAKPVAAHNEPPVEEPREIEAVTISSDEYDADDGYSDQPPAAPETFEASETFEAPETFESPVSAETAAEIEDPEMPADPDVQTAQHEVIEPAHAPQEPAPVYPANDKENEMIWYDDEEERKRKTEGVAEVMVDLFNAFLSDKPAEPVDDPVEDPVGEAVAGVEQVETPDDRVRRRLFAELDSIEAPGSPSEAWLKCDGASRLPQLFRDLDQER